MVLKPEQTMVPYWIHWGCLQYTRGLWSSKVRDNEFEITCGNMNLKNNFTSEINSSIPHSVFCDIKIVEGFGSTMSTMTKCENITFSDFDVTDLTIVCRCTPTNLNLSDFNLFYFLGQGVNMVEVKYSSFRCTPVTDDISCCLCIV